jgi:hypothetical protein
MGADEGDGQAVAETGEIAIRWMGDMQRLEVRPGDVLVVRVNQKVPPEKLASLSVAFGRMFPEQRCLVLDQGLELGVMGARDAGVAA